MRMAVAVRTERTERSEWIRALRWLEEIHDTKKINKRIQIGLERIRVDWTKGIQLRPPIVGREPDWTRVRIDFFVVDPFSC